MNVLRRLVLKYWSCPIKCYVADQERVLIRLCNTWYIDVFPPDCFTGAWLRKDIAVTLLKITLAEALLR